MHTDRTVLNDNEDLLESEDMLYGLKPSLDNLEEKLGTIMIRRRVIDGRMVPWSLSSRNATIY